MCRYFFRHLVSHTPCHAPRVPRAPDPQFSGGRPQGAFSRGLASAHCLLLFCLLLPNRNPPFPPAGIGARFRSASYAITSALFPAERMPLPASPLPPTPHTSCLLPGPGNRGRRRPSHFPLLSTAFSGCRDDCQTETLCEQRFFSPPKEEEQCGGKAGEQREELMHAMTLSCCVNQRDQMQPGQRQVARSASRRLRHASPFTATASEQGGGAAALEGAQPRPAALGLAGPHRLAVRHQAGAVPLVRLAMVGALLGTHRGAVLAPAVAAVVGRGRQQGG